MYRWDALSFLFVSLMTTSTAIWLALDVAIVCLFVCPCSCSFLLSYVHLSMPWIPQEHAQHRRKQKNRQLIRIEREFNRLIWQIQASCRDSKSKWSSLIRILALTATCSNSIEYTKKSMEKKYIFSQFLSVRVSFSWTSQKWRILINYMFFLL
jgi:hypothetical protein